MKKKLTGLFLVTLLLLSGCGSSYSGLKKPLSGAQPEEETVSDGGFAARQGDWIYFINGDNFTRETERFQPYAGALCRMRTDGTDANILVEKDVSVFSVQGEYVCMAIYENNKSYACRAKMDGTGFENFGEIDNIYNGGCFALSEEYFYYTRDFCLWRMKRDGTEKTRLTGFQIYNLRAGEQAVYFTRSLEGEIGNVFRLNNGSTQPTEITATPGYVLDVRPEGMYYYLLGNGKVYYYDAAAGSASAVVHGGYEEYLFAPDCICASYSEDNGENEAALYAIPPEGGARVKLADFAASRMAWADGWVYYINDSKLTELYRTDPKTGVTEQVSDQFVCDIDTLDVVDGWVYFFSDSDEGRIYRVEVSTGSCQCIEYENFGIVE